MSSHNLDPTSFEGLYWSPNAPAKLGQVAVGRPDQYHSLLDFDNCMTTDQLDSWGVVRSALSQTGQDNDHSYNYMWSNGYLDEQTWWEHAMANHISDGVTIADIESKAQLLEARPGLAEFVNRLRELGTPEAVASAGIGYVIDLFNAQNKLKPAIVLANRFNIADDGHILSYAGDIIHAGNKSDYVRNHEGLRELATCRPYAFVVGDGRNDPNMAPNKSRALSFRVGMPQDLPRRERNRFVQKSFEVGYDAVSADGTFRPLPAVVGAVVMHQSTEYT